MEFLTAPELAKRWRLNAQTLANWRCSKKGPAFIRVGSRVLYPLDAIHDYEYRNQWHSKLPSPETSAASPRRSTSNPVKSYPRSALQYANHARTQKRFG